MTKAELIEALKDYNDDAEVEISTPQSRCTTLTQFMNSEKMWMKIHCIDTKDHYLHPEQFDPTHCLISAYKIIME